jgi:hypothetical protein
VVYLLMACVVYAPGTLLYVMSRREQGLRDCPDSGVTGPTRQ